MLRLEYLFDRFNHFARSDDPELHHNALTTLFELGDISARGDIKSLLLKELERQKFALNQLKHAKEVDQEKLASTMAIRACKRPSQCVSYQAKRTDR